MTRKLRFLLIAVAFLLFIPVSMAFAEKSLLYYILDGSGSMWGRVDGKLKIQVAKDVMSTLIKETPSDIHCGLMIYGHRRKGDCSDIEMVIPIGPLNKEAAIGAIRRISPKGKTPISDSIAMAIDKLKATEYVGTVVLVSDGIETCWKDPSSITKALKATGVNFVMHVVGFAVKSETAKQLSCIAEAGGGQYFSTSNATDLLTALNQIKQSVVEKKEIKPPPPKPAPEPKQVQQKVSKSSTSIRIKAKGPGRVSLKHDSWLKPPKYWRLVDPETGEEKAKFSGLEDQVVPQGEYQVVWRQIEHGSTEVTLGEVISVESGKTTDVFLKTGIQLITPEWIKRPRFWGLQDQTTGKEVVTFSPLQPQLVPSGKYNLIWRQSEHGSNTLILAEVTIEPDKLNQVKLSTALNLVPADWLPKNFRFWELQDVETSKPIAHFRMGFQPQLVPTGTYRVVFRKGEHNSSNSYLGDVTIKEGVMNEFPVNTGFKLLPTKGIKPPYRIEYIELNDQGKGIRTVFLSGSFDPMPLKPGKYKITYRQKQHGSTTVTLVESFDLPAGNLVEVEF